jgi:hypothetical protein
MLDWRVAFAESLVRPNYPPATLMAAETKPRPRLSQCRAYSVLASISLCASNVVPIIREVQATGHTSCNAIAELLNARKVAIADCGRRTHEQVRQILDRAHDRR